MNTSASSSRTLYEKTDKRRVNAAIAPAAGGLEDDMTPVTYREQHDLHSAHIETADPHGRVLSSHSHVSPSTGDEDADSDIIEVFRFDRNSLKLRCEEISPKQLKNGPGNENGVQSSSATSSMVEKNVKIEPLTDTSSNSSSSSTSSTSSSSSSGSDSESDSSSSSSSKTSSSSTSSSENSNTSKVTSTSRAAGTSSSTLINSTSSNRIMKNKSNKKDFTPASSDSTSSDISSSSETDNASSDIEDELKRPKRMKTEKRQWPSMSKQCTQTRNSNFSSNSSELTKEIILFCNTQNLVPVSRPICGAVSTAHIKAEIVEKSDDDEEIFSGSSVTVAMKRENEEDEEEMTDDMVNIDDLVEGRNRQRKNSKWADYVGARKSTRLAPKTSFINKNYEAQIKKRLRTLLKKPTSEWTEDDRTTIENFPKLLSEVEKRLHKKEVASERLKESEDPAEILDKKCAQLASVISRARYLIIYTGAGISTSAKIPDYRGPNGIWTMLQKGEQVTQSLTDISQTADPTPTHMAIKALYDGQICKHVVSQNVDGLHLRSGIPKVALSEVHGNMYVEACTKCGREFVRLFDVTENTRRHHHKTSRHCYHCGTPLRDTVVLFGEKGSLRWPLNWQGAEYNVDKADVILCLGSSLKVLRRYPWLWSMAKPPQKRPKLYIVNLQWTPKDQFSLLKINGKCDEVMEKVMAHLNLPIPQYCRETDAIFTVATSLHPDERHTKSSSELWYPSDKPYPEKNKDLRNYIRFEPIFKVPIPYEQKSELIRKVSACIGSGGGPIEDGVGDSASLELKQEREKQAKQRKRMFKGNNFSWLGNQVISKQQKRRKLK